jgi:hypothetical protein
MACEKRGNAVSAEAVGRSRWKLVGLKGKPSADFTACHLQYTGWGRWLDEYTRSCGL